MAATQFTSPVGRLVFGSVWEGSTTDSEGKPRVVKSGPNAGKPATQWSFGVAFPKVLANGQPNAEYNAFAAMILDAGRVGYPQFFNGPIDPLTGKPGISPGVTFATKIKDGDGFDTKGKPNREKEGWAGHWVVVFSSMYAPRVFDINVGLDPTQQLQDNTRVMPGDYVAINGTVEANVGSQTPGVYVNGNMVCFVGGGPRIVSGPKASEAFKGVMASQLPPGCVPGAPPSLPTAAPLPTGGAVPPAPGAPSVNAGAAMVPNVTGYVPPVAAPVPTPAPIAAPVSPQLTPAALAAGFTTYAAAIAQGWTDALLTQHGYLAAAAPVVPTPPVPPAAPAIPTPPVPPAAPVGPQLTPAALAAGFTDYAQALANGWNDAMLRQHGYLV